MLSVLSENPVVVLFLVLAAGGMLGAVRLGGIAAGPAGALFAGLALSWAFPVLAGVVPPLIGTLGLALFAYTVGLASGPSFFAGVKRNGHVMAGATAIFVGVAVLAWVLGQALGLSGADTAGVYAGAVTNTPGVAAAVEVVGTNQPVVGYSLAYPFGVLGMILAIVGAERWARRRPTEEDLAPVHPPTYGNVEVTRTDEPLLAEFTTLEGDSLVFSRLRRKGQEGTPNQGQRVEPGDILTVIGSPPAVSRVTKALGRPAESDLPMDRRQVDFRRIVLSNPRYAGATVASLDLGRFDAVAGYVRRGDVDLVAAPDLIVDLGDRIRVVAPRGRLHEVATELGDSERAVVVADPIGLSLGLLLGLLLGLVPIPLPGLTLQLGTAAAPLLVGLVLGKAGHIGPVSWQLPYATNQALRQFGVLLFLATVGLAAGPEVGRALGSSLGAILLGVGMILTSVAALGLFLLARQLGLGAPRVAGTLAGAQNQPAVLAFAVERMDGDDRVNLAYALLFPPTFVIKIICAQVLAML